MATPPLHGPSTTERSSASRRFAPAWARARVRSGAFAVAAALSLASFVGCPILPRVGELPSVSFHELPGEVDALYDLADKAHLTTRTVEGLIRAETALRKAESIEPGRFGTAWRLARVGSLLGREDPKRAKRWASECLAAAERASTLAPERVEGWVYLAICRALSAQANPAQADPLTRTALEAADKADAIDDTFGRGEARRLKGALYLYAPAWPSGVGDLDEAIEVLTDVMNDFPKEPLNVFYLAEAYRKAEQRESAVKGYRLLLRFPKRGIWGLEGHEYRDQARSRIRELTRH